MGDETINLQQQAHLLRLLEFTYYIDSVLDFNGRHSNLEFSDIRRIQEFSYIPAVIAECAIYTILSPFTKTSFTKMYVLVR